MNNFSSKEFGSGEAKWTVLQDKLGRLFVGGDKLEVFDGLSWQSFSMGNTYALRTLAFGVDGRLWAGAINEVGYFTEDALGVFKYHSLVAQLPQEYQLVGDVWSCFPIGRVVYFVCRDKLLRWDGTVFQVQLFPGKTRLFPVKLGDEYWFQHWETGLYRLTEEGAKLEIPATALPEAGLFGLRRDGRGLVLATGNGFYRPGSPPQQISSDELNKFFIDSIISSVAILPDGHFAVGTITGGIALVSPTGELRRILDTGDGLMTRGIYSIQANADGELWCATASGIFSFDGRGQSTLFNSLNGLRGKPTKLIQSADSPLYALTIEGSFQLARTPAHGGHFQPLPPLDKFYEDLLVIPGGLLLSRKNGMDFFDGTELRSVFAISARTVFLATPARTAPLTYYLSESRGLSKLVRQADGTFVRTRLVELPDACNSIQEDSTGRLWLGTVSRGAFTYDPGSGDLNAVNDPLTGQPLVGEILVQGDDRRILLFLDGRVLQAGPDGTGIRPLTGVPAFHLVAPPTQRGEDLLLAFKRTGPGENSPQGLGVLSVNDAGQVSWRELDVPTLSAIGFVSTMKFSEDAGRPHLWIGGTEGVLRLDYEALPVVQKPTIPFIRLDPRSAGQLRDASGFSFSFRDHQLSFRIFPGEYTKTKDWVFQSRLANGEWSAPTAQRSFEFSNLSEGDYRFEVRAVNAAGLTSEPSVFAFHILPPWYRSGWALAGYLLGVGLVVVAVIRVRERRIRARNEELATLVTLRTAELVKANAAKDEFLAGISHEIRNPMNGVIGIADNFKTDGLDPEGRRKFSLLRQCATHLSSLLEDILDFSKVQAGAVEIEAKPFDLPELMDSITAMTAADSEKRGIPVEIAVSPAVPAKLIGDPKRVRQILLNFVSNALKFSGRGKVCVTVWCKTMSPAATEVIFAVSDEGPGISPAEQARLFTRFERGAAAQQGRVPGTGLGLALCKGLAEKMGGRIWLESEPGQGSCFSFSAPFAIDESAVSSAPAAITAAPVPTRARAALVVDDQEYNRIVLTDLLEALGFTVHNAGDGTAALALAAREDFDAVFLDYNLPGLSGLEVARGLRALPNKSAAAVIMATTAFSTPEKRNQCLAAGMNAFLGKPVTRERLRQVLAAALPAGPAAAPAPARPPADGLANLRLLAAKKKISFASELALYLSELEVELGHLQAAAEREDGTATAHYAHLLYGRCAFIAERELEQVLRKIEADSALGQWAGVQLRLTDLAARFTGLRLRLASSAPVAPPA
ncbi:MAG: ATP-binding protein [Lacunisphaera sp.]|nr:ATP-binding protein [Lacunisphaera sp.]